MATLRLNPETIAKLLPERIQPMAKFVKPVAAKPIKPVKAAKPAKPTKPAEPKQVKRGAEKLAADQAGVIRKAKADRKVRLRKLEALLRQRYPAAINDDRRPLMIGVHKVLCQADLGVFTNKLVRLFIKRWVTNHSYLANLIADAARIDLDGNPTGVVLKEQEIAAKAVMTERDRISAERAAAFSKAA